MLVGGAGVVQVRQGEVARVGLLAGAQLEQVVENGAVGRVVGDERAGAGGLARRGGGAGLDPFQDGRDLGRRERFAVFGHVAVADDFVQLGLFRGGGVYEFLVGRHAGQVGGVFELPFGGGVVGVAAVTVGASRR